MFDIPVLIIVFNRPDLAIQAIRAIKQIKPAKIYIAGDGPRTGVEGEAKICLESRDVVLKEIDWDCQVQTLFQEVNLGCALGVSTAINWFFRHEEMGIILEDDCIPGESFFSFCRTLLLHYKDDEEVMHIAGFNDQNNIQRGDGSYFFSNFPIIWGWASWRRAWQHYDFNVENIDSNFKSFTRSAFYGNKDAAERWLGLLFYNLDSTWDYQWDYSIFRRKGLCISPNVSLIKNIGFDERATHTLKPVTGTESEVGIMTEIIHPSKKAPDPLADKLTISKKFYAHLLRRVYIKATNKLFLKTA
jgi:hypothetical protein